MANKTRRDKSEWLWLISFVCLGIVAFSFFQVIEIDDTFMHPIFLILIAGLWREVAVLQSKISDLEKR